MASEYDVVGAFQRIEEELIASMSRNMKRHIGDEIDEGFDWTQWQAEMLNGLAKYRTENSEMLEGYFLSINDQIEQVITQAHASGREATEAEILEAIQEGYHPSRFGGANDDGFFGVNDRKLNALIGAITNDFEKAENSILRRTEDVYRSVIFNAQMYYNTGAASLDAAVDMATKDFLAKGIDCVRYANGAMVNIASYAEMALRTGNKRANLLGAAQKRDEWGIHLVEVTSHMSACPKCIPWQGQVYVDDVYGSGTSAESMDSGYPLLSTAVDGGMFHPNCRNGCSTYYEGISRKPHKATPEEEEEMARRYNLSQDQRECERNMRKYRRLAAGSQDAGNVAMYNGYYEAWKEKYKKLLDDNPGILREDPRRLKLYGINDIPTKSAPKKTKSYTVDMGTIEGFYGKKHANGMKGVLNNCGNEVATGILGKYEHDLNVYNPKYKGRGAHYSPSERGIRCNIAQDAKGSDWQTPYNVAFHEFGHNLDYVIGQEYNGGTFGRTYSELYNDGALGKSLKTEAQKNIEKYIKDNPGATRTDYFADLKAKLSMMQRADVSDMYEGATGVSYPMGIGHGAKYYTNRDNGKEAFAEMYSAVVANPESLNTIKEQFPDSFELFMKMLEEVL